MTSPPRAATAPRTQVLLIELPTYPKGTIALSLYAVAAAFAPPFAPLIIDLNFQSLEQTLATQPAADLALCGLKVSAQNYTHAKNTRETKNRNLSRLKQS